MRLDAHLHLWDRSLGVHDWIGPHLGGIDDDFPPERARPLLDGAGITEAVLVQAADDARDTHYLLDAAARHDWITGVVGWVDLERPGEVAASLDGFANPEFLCGIRQLVHDDPRTDVLALDSVRRSAAILAEHGLPLDVPDAFPRQLTGALALADAVPDLTLVLDHLGKPPRGRAGWDEWGRQVRELAQHEQVVAKVSGLQSSDASFDVESLRATWELALDAFGTTRLMFGSDWPMTVDGPGYGGVVATVAALIGELSVHEQDDLWWRTAAGTYHLEVSTKESR